MIQAENFLHTTHRTVNWFRKAHAEDELELSASFQRNPVWTNAQKSYLIDTILHGLPIPELYMQDIVDGEGGEQNLVVDGQQRVRAFLDFVAGEFALEGEEVAVRWRNLTFDDLETSEKTLIYSYKFVVRVLPEMTDQELRGIFARLNRNVVALNDQELRNATYWGPFISLVQLLADVDSFWADCGVFSANDHRRMLDHQFISELMVAFLHGPQNKKDKLGHYYRIYEEEFEQEEEVAHSFSTTTAEIGQLLGPLSGTRWRKKSDFYTLFLALIERVDEFPFSRDRRKETQGLILKLGREVDAVLKLDDEQWGNANPIAVKYARNVTAASDRSSRIARTEALEEFVFGIQPAG